MAITVFEQRLLESLARKLEEVGGESAIIDGELAFRWYDQPIRVSVSRG